MLTIKAFFFFMAPNKKTLFGRIIAWVHLWPSIISGILVVFICLTGVIIVYCDEIMDFTAGDAKYVKEVGQKRISSLEIFESIRARDTALEFSEIVLFKDPKRSIRLRAFTENVDDFYYIYMDPYTGQILKLDPAPYFFYVMAHLHSSFLAEEAGLWIAIIATIIFLISCITGLVLWWPKKWNKATRQASFAIKWKVKFKRLNYDLHNVLGFYALIISIIMGGTALMMFFSSLTEFTVESLGGELQHLDEVYPDNIKDPGRTVDFVPLAYKVFEEYPEKPSLTLWTYNLDESGLYVFYSGHNGFLTTHDLDLSGFNKYTGEKTEIRNGLQIHEKTENMIMKLHMGHWWGQFGKFSTFLAGLIATSLPVTGFLVWWGKKNKKPTKRKQPVT